MGAWRSTGVCLTNLGLLFFFISLRSMSLDAVLLNTVTLLQSMLVRAGDSITLSITTISVNTLDRVESLTISSRVG